VRALETESISLSKAVCSVAAELQQSTPVQKTTPVISVIIPVYNGAETIGLCLSCLYASAFPAFEIIVIDDQSTDDTAALLKTFPCKTIKCTVNAGPAAARNLGALRAEGQIFFFLDADILVEPNSLTEIAAAFSSRPEMSAMFGSYQPHSVATNFFSSFKNLVHHHTHQTSNEAATTFCGGFGAIRRETFFAMDCFDVSYRFLEDVEFGERLNRGGHKVWLNKDLQFSHCKRYSLLSLIRSDLYGRAIPWTRFILKTGTTRNDLNTQTHHVWSVLLSYVLLLAVPALSSFTRVLIWISLALTLVLLNGKFLRFVRLQRGTWFACGAALMSWLVYLYCGVGVAIGVAGHFFSKERWSGLETEDTV
jgi:glycosyltransferase involved in cell wall biosynthesis